MTWHSVYKPHGDGRHGSFLGMGKYAFEWKTKCINQWKFVFFFSTDGVKQFIQRCLTIVWDRMAADYRVSSVTRSTIAHWRMIDDRAFGIHTARIFTRIDTLCIDTSKIKWTIKALQAFGSTANIRITKIVLHASTRTNTIMLPTYWVTTTRCGRTYIRRRI